MFELMGRPTGVAVSVELARDRYWIPPLARARFPPGARRVHEFITTVAPDVSVGATILAPTIFVFNTPVYYTVLTIFQF